MRIIATKPITNKGHISFHTWDKMFEKCHDIPQIIAKQLFSGKKKFSKIR